MTKLNIADIEYLIENEDEVEYEDKREIVRKKEAKNRFKENTDEN